MSIAYRTGLAALPARIAAKIAPPDENGCWPWTGSLNAKGYASVHYKGRKRPAHRVVYVLLVGPIPTGFDIDHVRDRGCRLRSCMNPEHMEPVTHRENLLRGDTITARNAQATHCPHGHRYDASNTGHNSGKRRCLTCHRDREHARFGAEGPPNALKTHCKHGHEFTAENTRHNADGERVCRTCHRERSRRARQK